MNDASRFLKLFNMCHKEQLYLLSHVQTDGVHAKDNIRSGNTTPETLSEAVKILKGEYVVRAIREHKMDR